MSVLNDIKIVFCDIDGTLVDNQKKVSLKTKQSILRIINKGIYFVLVSGRDYFHVINRVKSIGSSPLIIASNGALIYDEEKKEKIYFDRISVSKVKQVVDFCKENEIGLLIRGLSGRYYNDYLEVIDGQLDKYIPITENTDYDIINACQFLISSDDYNKTLSARTFIKSLNLEVTNYSESFLEEKANNYTFDVNNPDIDKGLAITKLLEYLNIKKEESICFGDFINDIDMFNACGIKVAMENAHPDLKEMADYITLSNTKDGVAYFLDKYL